MGNGRPYFSKVHVGDFNSDGILDLYVLGRSTDQSTAFAASIYRFAVHFPTSDPQFTFIDEVPLRSINADGSVGTPFTITTFSDFSIVDMDLDGDKDIFFSGDGNGSIGWYPQMGINSNTLGSYRWIFNNGTANQSHWVGDFDNDGDVDVVFNNAWGGVTYVVTQIAPDVWIGNQFPRISVTWSRGMVWGDFDQNGTRDFILKPGNGGWGHGLLMMQVFSDGLERPVTIDFYSPGYNSINLALKQVDIDGDGDLDIIANTGSVIRFLRNDHS